MNRTPEERARRAKQRRNQIQRLKAERDVLRHTIDEVWRWRTFDGEDLDRLKDILETADTDHALKQALDALENNNQNGTR